MKLKVLAGLHAGALVDLKGPVVLMGRDVQCDVILSDESVEPLHLLLFIDGDQVRVRMLNGGAWLDDEPITQETLWQPGRTLDLQGVQFELQSDEASEQPAADSGDWADTVLADAPSPIDTLIEIPMVPTRRRWLDRHARRAVAPDAAALHRKSWNARTASGVVCLCCAVTVLGVTFRELSASPSVPVKSVAAWSPAMLDAKLAEEAFQELKTTTDAAGVTVLTGYVADDTALQAVRAHLREPLQQGKVRLRLDTLTNLAKTLSQQIDDPGVKARFASPKQLELWGEATRAGTQSKIIRLQREFGSDFEIDARISYEEIMKAKADPVPKKVPMQIAHVSGGAQPSIVTQAGEQYFKGARLEDGTEVVSITTEKVVLRYGEKVVEYRFE
jgi:hypothetical protein